jgi:hypothetical protein
VHRPTLAALLAAAAHARASSSRPSRFACCPPQIALGVSVGSLILCAALNYVLNRVGRTPAVPGFTAPATHPDLYPDTAAASGQSAAPCIAQRPAPLPAFSLPFVMLFCLSLVIVVLDG